MKHTGRIIITLLLLALPASLNASISSKLDEWFNGQNYTNQTSPGVYEGQSARYFSMGGYSRRNNLNGPFELFSVQTPRISAGCGGIDVYAGGFSAIDSEALMNNIRAIGQASTSLAFMLAIQTVSPMLSDIMKQIQSWANEFNKWGMDSCQAAEELVGGSLEMFGVDKGNCIVKAMNNRGLNYRDAEDLCTNEAGGESVLSGPGGPNQIDFVRGNLAWYVLMKDPFFSTDTELAQMAMNITGTVIIEKENPAVADSPLVPTTVPSAVDDGVLTDRFRNIYEGLMEGQGTTMQLYRCEGGASADRDNGCARVTTRPQDTQVTTPGLRSRVQNSFRSIMQKVQTDSALTQEEQGLISSTRIPVYRFLTAISAAFPNAIDIEQAGDEYSRLIASEIINEAMLRMIDVASLSAENLDRGMSDSSRVKAFKDQLSSVRKGVAQLSLENRSRAESLENMMDRIVKYERMLIPRLGRGVIASATWRR